MANSLITTTDVHTLLAALRDDPIDNSGASDAVLGKVYQHLMAVPIKPPEDTLHWFCHRAELDTVAAATFLIRLFAYNSTQVDNWKSKLQSCLSRCSDCVQGLEQAKVSSKNTYFGAFQEDVLKGFYLTFEQWELTMVIRELASARMLDQPPGSTQRTLSSVHPAVAYRMVSNWTVFRDPRVLSVIRTCPPAEPLPGWPHDALPPGMFVLLMDDNPSARKWARIQASKCTNVPMSNDQFIERYGEAIEAIGHALTLARVNNAQTLSLGNFSFNPTDITPMESMPFSFASDPYDLWSGFRVVLRLIPVESLTSSARQHGDLRRVVTGHLHDTGPQFPDVLYCLLFLLKRMGDKFWAGEGPEFPQVVFDAVKDNPSFSQLLQNIDPVGTFPWFLTWFVEYLHTIRELPVYGEVLAKIADFLCEETQHERFRDARPIIMACAISLLLTVLRKCQTESAFLHQKSVLSTLDIHGETFLAVAFGRSFDDEKWKTTRSSARKLAISVLEIDIQEVSTAVTGLCKALARAQSGRGPPEILPTLSIRKQMWKKLYPSVQTNDVDGIATLIAIVAKTAHMDTLNTKPFAPAFQLSKTEPGHSNTEGVLNEVNRSLGVIWDGFLAALSRYADYNASSSALDMLRRPGVVKDVMLLMLSPVEDIQAAARTLVGLAFDVDIRQDCFRVLLENLPDAALEGIFEFLSIFVQYAPVLPEACNLSKSLVRCFTDIIEVLCASTDGLLHNQQFLRPTDEKGPASKLPNLWNLMTKSLMVIFKRTPLWSTYFDSGDMIVWMRDALIFGRDMLAQWRVIETAANCRPSAQVKASGKLSSIGKKMVTELQEVLPELARWLRLTDEELLHQSFALLQSLLECFKETHIPPSEVGIAKLAKHIENARKKDPSLPKTRLDSTRLLKLESALAYFENDDDEIEIISYTPAPKAKDTLKPKPDLETKPSTSRTLRHTDLGVHLPARSSSKSSKSHFFTDRDQQGLDAVVSLPTFRKPPTVTTVLAPLTRRSDTGPKNEGLAQTARPDTSSSSESESEDDGTQGSLATLGKFQRSPKIRKQVERRQIKTLDIPVQKNPMQERIKRRDDSRRAALRLKPDISGLHKVLLSWNFEHDGSEPPGSKLKLIQVPDKFVDYAEYRRVFEPLLLLECWSQIMQAKEEKQEVLECKVNSRQFSDDWLDLEISLIGDVHKDWYLAETDVVLLRHLNGKKCIMAKTRSYRATPNGRQAGLRCFIQNGNTDPGLQINTNWRLSKLFSLSTLHREYAALVSLPYYDFCEAILQPSLSGASEIERRDIEQAMATYNVNKPQATAILSSLQTDGFALIQGPPGTGKTSTICGLIAASLSKRTRTPVAVHVGRSTDPADRKPAGKILLCAPSNAAIDEIANRIKMGFRGSERRPSSTKVVRIGAEKSMNISVKDISLDHLVDQKLNSSETQSKDTVTEFMALRRDMESLRQQIMQKEQEKATIHDNGAREQALGEELTRLKSHKRDLGRQFDRLKDKQRSDSRSLDAIRRKTRVEVLQDADVVCSTLSGAGHEILEQFDFEMVIIDEAAQAIELSSLIPLKYRSNRCIMVGDPQQLPPTVLSQEACRFHYNESLFVRLQKQRPDAVHLLSIQYRMHPDISRLPSHIFYQDRLQDGPGMGVKTQQPWHSHLKFGTYRFFNVSRGQEEQSGRSVKNMAECHVAIALYARLCKEFSSIEFESRIGVVSMYRAQIVELRRQFQDRFGRDIVDKVDFNTVDGFQGQEKDIIILSCVRAGPGLQSVGFLSDIRRMNVALTRAKSSLFILGNAATLERSDMTWRDIVLDARSRSSLLDTDPTYFTQPTTSRRPPPPKATKMASSAAIPVDLLTPSDFKATVQHMAETTKPVPTSSEPKTPTPTDIPLVNGATTHGIKRPAEDDNQATGRPMPARPRIEGTDTKPQIAKRPKQPNIFLPKSNKRRPPEATSAGPSNNRRL